MRANSLRRAFVRALVLAVLVAGVTLALGSAAFASGPTALGVSGWQVYSNTTIYPNPTAGVHSHGYQGEYAASPAIPSQSDPGWANCGPSSPLRSSPYAPTLPLCPSATTIGMGVGSILPGCWSNLNFTYFQALVSIPAGTTISQFSVNMSGADDGARISLVNSLYPGGVTPSDGYIFLGGAQATGNLASFVAPGEVNRVVITQVDDCAVGNNLNSAQVFLNGTVIPPDTTPPTDAPVVSPAANGAGWNSSDVTVDWHWTDSGSGVDPAHCTQTSTSSGEGTLMLTSSCQDNAGNSASDSRTVKVDKTAPADSPVVSPAPNGAGWNTSDVTVNWHWTDGGSGIDPSSCTQTSASSGEGAITLSSTCTDLAGNSASDSVTVHVDKAAPTDAPVVTPAANASGWNKGDVSVAWHWTDGGSGIDPSSCTQSSTSSGEGTITLSSTCADLAGNSASDSVTVKVDKTAPTDAPVVSPAANGNGWNSGNVSVAWNWTDAGGSGIDSSSCTQSSTSSGEGTITLTSTCADLAGNSASDSVTVKVDKTAPTDSPVVTPAANGAGWNNTDVTVAWHWADGGSGIDPSSCTQTSVSSGEGTITLTSTCADLAGNSASDSVTVKVDKTAPVVSYSGNAGSYAVDQSVSIGCSATDALSGIASSTCASVSGPAWSFGLGSHTFSASATDKAGNTGSGSTTFAVTVDATSLCGLVKQFSTKAGIANSLCAKLDAAAAAAARGQAATKANILGAFDNEVAAQSGKALTAAQAKLLTQLAAAL